MDETNEMPMRFEVEVKAWADDLDALEERLKVEAEFIDESERVDTYFAHQDKSQGRMDYRLRVVDGRGKGTVTAKRKRLENGVEINSEYEYNVSDPEAFKANATQDGFVAKFEKRKKVRRYRLQPGLKFPLTVELVRIEGLGKFIEVEALVESLDLIESAQKAVRGVLKDLGVPEERIEPRPYMQMIKQNQDPSLN